MGGRGDPPPPPPPPPPQRPPPLPAPPASRVEGLKDPSPLPHLDPLSCHLEGSPLFRGLDTNCPPRTLPLLQQREAFPLGVRHRKALPPILSLVRWMHRHSQALRPPIHLQANTDHRRITNLLQIR